LAKPQLRELSIDEVADPAAPARSEGGFGDLNELAESIRAVGIIEPIVVARRNGKYEVVAGHRRLLAARMIRLARVPCVIHDTFAAAEEAVMLHENIHRADLNPVDEARFFQRIAEKVNNDLDQVAELVRERRDYIENRLRLLDGDEDVLGAVAAGLVSLGVAAELNLYHDPSARRAHLALAIEGGATVNLVRQWRKQANQFYELQQTRHDAPAPPAEPTPLVTGPAPFTCYFCRSAEHVEAMEQIYIHKPCKGLLKNALGERFSG